MAKKSKPSTKQTDPATQDSLAERVASLRFALETAIVLAERQLLPGQALIDEWKIIANSH